MKTRSPGKPPSDPVAAAAHLEMARSAAALAAAARAAQAVEFEEGAVLAPDSPPGRGWKLTIPKLGTPRYFEHRENAVAYRERWLAQRQPS